MFRKRRPTVDPTPSRAFDHERLDVYKVSLDFVALSRAVILDLPRGRAGLADQLERAAASIALNTAEGCGEFSRKEKARFFRMALRSAAECSAILDVARNGAISETRARKGKDLLQRVAAMLTMLVRRHDAP